MDCIHAVPLDAMHLCDLGIIKRVLEFLFKTSDRHATIPDVTFNPATIRAFDNALLALRSYVSRHDFARTPRSVKDIPRFKATEFRLFLHYIKLVFSNNFLATIYSNIFCVFMSQLDCYLIVHGATTITHMPTNF